jgi:tetratricopeptide (TPR) repeat protein
MMPNPVFPSRPVPAFLVGLGLALVLVAVCPPASARADTMSALELDQGALDAERALRAAETRPGDEIAMSFYRRASAQAEAALSRNPDSPTANFIYFAAQGRLLLADGLAKNLFTLRNLDKKYLDRALELDPRYANALAAKGGVLLDLPTLIGGNPAEGLRLLRRANELNPGGVGTRVSLARALARSGDVGEARRQARLAAHHACVQRRRKALDDATGLLAELDSTVARAGMR